LYRLGLRVVQFSTQTCFNAFADSEADGAAVWHGINSRGRELVAAMNELACRPVANSAWRRDAGGKSGLCRALIRKWPSGVRSGRIGAVSNYAV